jgi:hypothetical protein
MTIQPIPVVTAFNLPRKSTTTETTTTTPPQPNSAKSQGNISQLTPQQAGDWFVKQHKQVEATKKAETQRNWLIAGTSILGIITGGVLLYKNRDAKHAPWLGDFLSATADVVDTVSDFLLIDAMMEGFGRFGEHGGWDWW